MVSRSFAWIATEGGAWSLASNWDDLTDGIDPSLVVPGAGDSVSVAGPSGSAIETLTGVGDVASAAFAGNCALSGSFAAGSASLGAGGGGGLLDVGAGGTLSAGALGVASGSVLASGAGARIGVAGVVTLGAGQQGLGAAAANLYATSGGVVQAAGLVLDASSASIYMDADSSVEVGTLGGAVAGVLTVDAGAVVAGFGDADGYGDVVNDGVIVASGGSLLVGAVAGAGVLEIAGGAELVLNGAVGAGEAVVFETGLGTLGIATEFDDPTGVISGFVAGDAIDMIGSPISAATWVQSNSEAGVLTLWYGGQVADVLSLAGNFSKSVFLTAGDGGLGTLITVAPETGGGGTASPGTATPDQYVWEAAGSGNWIGTVNWKDLSTGKYPASIAPGVNDLATINGSQAGSFSVIAGPANAASLTVTGDVALVGSFSIGTLAIGVGGEMLAGVLDILPGSVLAAGSAAVGDGEVTVSGSAVLDVAGALVLGGGYSGVGLPVTALSATAGGTIVAASLVMGGGSGNSVITDPTGVIEIGSAGGAAAGAVTIDAGAMLSGNGEVNPFGAIVDNGTIEATGGALWLGSVTGTGVLSIGDSSALVLQASDAMAIDFLTADLVLAVANEFVVLSGVVSGFVEGDAIDYEGDPLTGIALSRGSSTTTLSFYYGSTLVSQVVLAGLYTNERFLLAPDGVGGTEILVTPSTGGGGGTGQGDTDLLAWATPGSGPWSHASNWYDVTTGSPATAAPGTENSVQIAGPTGGSYQIINGPAACANVTFFNNTLINGAFTTGTLAVGGTLAGVFTTGLLAIGASSSMTATVAASIAGGTLVLNAATSALSCVGVLTLGSADGTLPASVLAASNGATAQLAGLVLAGGGTLTTDATAVIEIGTLGGAAAGAVTIDPGVAVAGSGSVNVGGDVIDNGTLTAQGGTLVVGAVSGVGALTIGAEATLWLTAGEVCPIDFAGGGGTLLLEGSEETPAGVIGGFVQGDEIVTGSSQVSSVVFAPGAGEVGTLTLYDGGVVAGTLLLAGNFSGEVFTVQPDQDGSEIGVQAASGPPAGTVNPDDYVWTGNAGTLWSNNENWNDLTAGQMPAAVAPGAQDLVTITGGTAAFATIVGPADAASLSLFERVVLSGAFSIRALDVGSATQSGLLALGQGTTVQAASVAVIGGIEIAGGELAASGTLTLSSGVLAASAQASVEAAGLVLAGADSAVTTDGTAIVEIGGDGVGMQGVVTVDAGAVLAGAGAVNPLGAIDDQGTITASGGTLVLGDLAGDGMLDIGVGATMVLEGAAAISLTVDFAGAGTLTIAGGLPGAYIGGFGAGDDILLPISGITSTSYDATEPNTGVLTLYAGSEAVGELTLLGVGGGQSFAVAADGSGTMLTTAPTNWGGGGSTMRNPTTGSGSGSYGVITGFAFFEALSAPIQLALEGLADGLTSYVWTSPDGSYFGPWQPGYSNIAVVTDPTPLTKIVLPAAYQALLAEGNTAVTLTDGGAGRALIVGNAANDTIVGFGANDTLAGGVGGNTVFFDNADAVIYGAGNDSIVTGEGDCVITTAFGYRSLAFVGAASNQINLGGNDTVICAPGNGANDTINATGNDTVFAPAVGELTHNGGDGRDLVVGTGGTVRMVGGTGNGSILWCGSANFAEFIGGAGSAEIAGGGGDLSVQGGGGALVVFAGTGNTIITGAAGPSEFVVGAGAATVTAASGNIVWAAGAGNESLIASGGDVIIWAANSTGNDVLQAGDGPCTLQGGTGNDTILGGTGNATMGGGGADIFGFTNGLGGASNVIEHFVTGLDTISLNGFSSYSSALVNGSEVISLSDGTHVELAGVTSMSGVTIRYG